MTDQHTKPEYLTLPLFVRPELGDIDQNNPICVLNFAIDEQLLAEFLQCMRDFDQGASFVSITLERFQLTQINQQYATLINPNTAEPELHLAPWGEFSPALTLQTNDGEWLMLVGPSVDFASLFSDEE